MVPSEQVSSMALVKRTSPARRTYGVVLPVFVQLDRTSLGVADDTDRLVLPGTARTFFRPVLSFRETVDTRPDNEVLLRVLGLTSSSHV